MEENDGGTSVGQYLKIHYLDTNKAWRLGPPSENPMKGGTVVIYSDLAFPVQKGQPIFEIRNAHGCIGNIQEIRINDQTVEEAPAGSEAGLRLDFKCSRRGNLYLLASKDEMIWG